MVIVNSLTNIIDQ